MTFGPAAETWRDRAACRTEDPALFFPPPVVGNSSALRARHEAATTAALAICRACPVQVECLTYAVAHGEHHGTWGGTTADERAAMPARRRTAS